jgi:hypothetical protein
MDTEFRLAMRGGKSGCWCTLCCRRPNKVLDPRDRCGARLVEEVAEQAETGAATENRTMVMMFLFCGNGKI